MKKDKQWLEKELRNLEKLVKEALEASLIAKNEHYTEKNSSELQLLRRIFSLINRLDEPERPIELQELIDKYSKDTMSIYEVKVEREKFVNDLQNLLVPKQDEVDRAYEEGREHGFYKGYREGLANKGGEPEPKNITLQDVTDKLWELPLNNRKLWLALLNDEFQEGYIVPLGLKTTDGEEQYLTYNGSYFASRRNKYLQQTFDTLEEIPEFYRGLAERVL